MADKYSVPLWRDSATSEGFVSWLASALGTYCNCVDREDRKTHGVSSRNRRGREESLFHVTMAKPGQNPTSCTQASQEKTHFQKTLIKQGPK